MEIKQDFDKIIKSLLSEPNDHFGYITNDNKIYDCYYRNAIFDVFVDSMSQEHYNRYMDGNGGELVEKKGRYGYVPPKMASVASSSRFIYLSLKDDSGKKMGLFESNIEIDGRLTFEDKLTINIVGAHPNIDATYKTNAKSLYFESKCHEIFDSHVWAWTNSYFVDGVFYGKDKKSLQLNQINERPHFINNIEIDKNKKSLDKTKFGLRDTESLKLDFKQFVCHLLGIANTKAPNKELIYLFYKPNALNNSYEESKDFNKVFKQLEGQFESFCQSECISNYCKRNYIKIKFFYATNNKMTDKLDVELIFSFGHNNNE